MKCCIGESYSTRMGTFSCEGNVQLIKLLSEVIQVRDNFLGRGDFWIVLSERYSGNSNNTASISC